ncbi:3-phosphoshikimate 1-carboxyvinyltransferase [Marichromatium bheemlicum]|uniref:3-phosphoshikimate 1-carboxyvinyltransferase n=2 Tax=Marichromatium bheemlicum TaxID=365339 RepID=A0ABX1IE10_9GAMM|nr:3-phosphoshikimate 1-carboxyvinyltransferase [Marichromatium bheemlicum]
MERLPQPVRDSFTEEQLSALKLALAARSWGRHAIDWRGTLRLWRYRYYIVFLVGRNRRTLSRGELQIGLWLQAIFIFIFLSLCTLIGLLALYIAKSAIGIDLFPGFSLGIWGWINS